MTREEAIKILDKRLSMRHMYAFKTETTFYALPDKVNEALDMAISALREQSGWISIEERLPGCGERVLATDDVFVGEAYRTSAKSWYRMTGFPWREAYGTVVKRWMPLPEAPKEEV